MQDNGVVGIHVHCTLCYLRGKIVNEENEQGGAKHRSLRYAKLYRHLGGDIAVYNCELFPSVHVAFYPCQEISLEAKTVLELLL